jgi:hypothetical protein
MEQLKLSKVTSNKKLFLFGALGALALFLCLPRNTVIISTSIGNINVNKKDETPKQEKA